MVSLLCSPTTTTTTATTTATTKKRISSSQHYLLFGLLCLLVLFQQTQQQSNSNSNYDNSNENDNNDDLLEQWKEEEDEEEEEIGRGGTTTTTTTTATTTIPTITFSLEENLEFHEMIRQHHNHYYTQQSDLEPPLRIDNKETMKHRQFIDQLLKEQYKQFNPYQRTTTITSNTTTSTSNNHYHHDQGKEYTYGELTSLGVRQLLQLLLLPSNKENKEEELEHNDSTTTTTTIIPTTSPIILYDLGSGIGKFVVQTVLENYTNIIEIIGIELSSKRHEMAVMAWNNIQQQLQQVQVLSPTTSTTITSTTSSTTSSTSTMQQQQQQQQVQQQPNVTFIHGNIIEQNFTNATHLYISSLCFPEDVIETLSQQIINNANKYSNIVSIATLSDLRLLEEQEQDQDQQQPSQQWIKTRHGIQMTWGQGEVRLYTRRRRHFHSTVGTKEDEKEEERT